MLTSNSAWLGIVNLAWCLLASVTPAFTDYPKATLWLVVATNVAAIVWKYMRQELPTPDSQPPPQQPIIRQK